jgi:argininosuccinate synthase
MVEIARAESADAVAHGATGKGNDHVRFELTVCSDRAGIESNRTVARGKIRKQFPGRAEMIAFANENKISVETSGGKAILDGP